MNCYVRQVNKKVAIALDWTGAPLVYRCFRDAKKYHNGTVRKATITKHSALKSRVIWLILHNDGHYSRGRFGGIQVFPTKTYAEAVRSGTTDLYYYQTRVVKRYLTVVKEAS